MKTATINQPKDDVWIRTVCDMCFSGCPVKVHRVDGVVVKIEGDEEGPHGNRKLCAKGFASMMSLYDPHRITRPLKRTNPEKGFDIDPKWQEITWDEALDTIARKLKEIKQDDPRKLQLSTSSTDGLGAEFINGVWAPAFGTRNIEWLGYFCGNYLHSAMYLTNGTFHSDFDIENCKYVILQGNQMGFMAGISSNLIAQKMAEARIRGMKVVAVDPVLTNAGGKADEWIPIRPGTDGAWMLGLINLLVNELGLYDAEFIKKKTNGSYLVGPDGHYVRKGQKPLVWDTVEGIAKPFDADVKDSALEGTYHVGSVECRPAFTRFRESVKEYTPERVSQITTIPVETIRRVAREYGETASIGSTVVVDGRKLPYRPVAVNIYRGAGAHAHGVFAALAVQMLNLIVGNYYAVGGHRGTNLTGPGWTPRASAEGLVIPHSSQGHGADYYDFEVGAPETTQYHELLPISTNRSAMVQHTVEDPERFKMPYRPEMLIILRHNQLRTTGSPKRTAEVFKKIPFVVYITTHEDEQAQFADILLPDLHFLETMQLFMSPGAMSVNAATGYYFWQLRQPVVESLGEARGDIEILIDLAERAGFLGDLQHMVNVHYNLKEQYKLEEGKKYSVSEMYDRRMKSTLGAERGLDWFKEHGTYMVKRSLEEKYPAPFLPVRFSIYFENLLKAGEEVKAVTDELGVEWDTSDYSPTLYWKPCPAYSEKAGDEFYAVNYRVPIHALSYTLENPWLNEVGKFHPSAYRILMNTATAAKKGIKDGDTIKLESEAGTVVGIVKVTNGVHPEVVGIAGTFGSESKGRPIARGSGVHFNSLVPVDLKHTDPISGGLDSCVRVTASKVEISEE